MKKIYFRLVVLLSFFYVLSYGKEIIIPKLTQEPRFDKKFLAADWTEFNNFELKIKDGRVPQHSSKVYIAYNDMALYFAFICNETGIPKVTYKNHEEYDNNIWDDDCVDLSIDPFGNSRIFKIIVNSAGIAYDDFDSDSNWNSNLTAAAHSSENNWELYLRIPFTEFGVKPKGGELWQMNIGRIRVADREQSSISGARGKFSDDLQEFRFAGAENFKLNAIDWRNLKQVAGVFKEKGKYRVRIETFSGESRMVEYDQEVEITNTERPMSFAWQNLKKADNIYIKVGDLYENSFQLFSAKATDMRIWQHKNTLYEELIDHIPEPKAVLRWLHEQNTHTIVPQAMQYGFAYDRDKIFQEIATSNNLVYAGYFLLHNEKIMELYTRNKLRILARPDIRRLEIPETKKNKRKLIFDPAAEECFVDQVKDMAENREKYHLDAIIFGDEVVEHTLMTLVEFNEENAEYPLISEIDQEIKQKYGAGKWGIPKSMADRNAASWIATHKFVNDKLAIILEKAYKTCKEIAPELPFVSDDPMGGSRSSDLFAWRGKFDIATVQLYPGRNANLADFAFNAKKVKDLSAAVDFRPCAHVEHYAANFTLAETLALLSQAVIGGATGWHYYLADTIGTRKGKGFLTCEYFGAPERYELLYKVAEQTPALKFPEPDAACYFSLDSSWSKYGRNPVEEIAAFSLIGAHSGVWLQIVDANVLQTENTSKYKVIFIAESTHENPANVKLLENYVKNGGVLVVLHPEAFAKDHLDQDRKAEIDKFFASKLSTKKGDMTFTFNGKKYNMLRQSGSLELLRGAEAVAKFSNGAAALSKRKLGKGAIYRFAFNPMSSNLVPSKQWQEFSTDFCQYLNLKTSQDIWRFAFPNNMVPKEKKITGKCLTGNSIIWSLFRADISANVPQNGSYSWSRKLDHIADKGQENISFDQGKLTDRIKAPTAGNVEKGHGTINDWTVRFNLSQDISLTFDFKEIQKLGKVNMFFQGEVPEITVETSVNASDWTELKVEKNQPTGIVKQLTLKLPENTTGQFLRVNFLADTTKRKIITLAEVDIWDR